MSFIFEWPLVFLLLPLPLLVRYLLTPKARSSESALRTPFADDLQTSGSRYAATGNWLLLLLATLAWVLLVVAAARPQLLGEPQSLPVAGRDLMMAVDVSGSMQMRDFSLKGRRVTRLDATKYVAGDFIARRTGDRVGLVLFGRQAYLQTPLTFDRQTVGQLLNESFIGMAGNETAIGDAIGLAIKRLRDNDVEEKTLVLLTDGANTAGAVDPIKAAELAAVAGLTIYTVGIGSDARSLRGFFTNSPRSSSLDEASLEKIASLTGGRYFRAKNSRELAEIYALLDQLEPVSHETAGFRPTFSLFYVPLALALLLGGIIVTWHNSLWSELRAWLSRLGGAHG